jgi:hypothetical protein
MKFVNLGKRRKTAATAPVRLAACRLLPSRCNVEYSRAVAVREEIAARSRWKAKQPRRAGRRGARLVRRDWPDLWAVHRWI